MKLFPKPRQCVCGDDMLKLDKLTVCAGAYQGAADFLGRAVERLCGVKADYVADGGKIAFQRDESRAAGTYRLQIDASQAQVYACDLQGAVMGAATLSQMLAETDAKALPCVDIDDAPYKTIRGVHMYMPSRKNIDAFCRILDMMAQAKMNMVIIEVGAGMEYERHPEVNTCWEEFCHTANHIFPGVGGSYAMQWADKYWKDSVHTELAGSSYLTKDEVRGIVAHAKSLGMEVIPEIQALSHSYYMTIPHKEIAELSDDPFPDSYCPLNEESYKLYFELAEEVLEVFEPSTVSIGHDEVRILGECPRCREKTGHELLAYELNRLHAFYAERGIRMAMWGEALQKFRGFDGTDRGGVEIERVNAYGAYYKRPATYEAINDIPNDILMLDWYHSLGTQTEECFNSHGIELIYGNFHGNNFADWEKRSRKPGVLGAELSTWCVTDEQTLSFDGLMYELLASAKVLWEEDHEDAKFEAMRAAVQDFVPVAKAVVHGYALPSSHGEASLVWKGTAADHPIALLNLCRASRPDTRAAKALDVFGELAFGVSVDTARLYMECDFTAKSLIVLAAAKQTMPYTASYRFPDYKQWDLGTIALFYEDGTVALSNLVYGKTVGVINYDFGRTLRKGAGAEAGENTEMGAGHAPYWTENMDWYGALAYETTIVRDGKTAAFAYEWENPHPEKRIVKLKVINASQNINQSAILFGIAAIN